MRKRRQTEKELIDIVLKQNEILYSICTTLEEVVNKHNKLSDYVLGDISPFLKETNRYQKELHKLLFDNHGQECSENSANDGSNNT